MNSLSRREFLLALGMTSLAGSAFSINKTGRKKNPRLSFSTLGCPDWPLKNIIDFAAANNYEGIEVRGILREMDLLKVPEFSSPEKIRTTMDLMKEKRLQFVNLGSSVDLHHPDGEARAKRIDEGKRYIDLAQKLSCPYVRVFPNRLPKEQDRAFTLNQISKGLIELGDYAKGSNVKVLMETHGDVVYVDDVVKIMQNSIHPNVGLMWDVFNMWTVTKESPTMVYQKLKKYVLHTHIKNAVLKDDKFSYVLIEKGQVPIFEAIDALRKDNYTGYYGFEWEKMWHPEIESPDIALADYPKVMMRYFSKK